MRQFLTHEFIERLSENIGLPNLLRLFLKLAEQIVYQFFRLLFRADDRIDLGFDVGPHHMDGWCRSPQTHAIPPSLPNDFRFLERQLLHRRHHNAVTGLIYLIERTMQPFVLLFHRSEILKHMNQICVIPHLNAGLLADNAVEYGFRYVHTHDRRAAAERHIVHARPLDVFVLFEGTA